MRCRCSLARGTRRRTCVCHALWQLGVWIGGPVPSGRRGLYNVSTCGIQHTTCSVAWQLGGPVPSADADFGAVPAATPLMYANDCPPCGLTPPSAHRNLPRSHLLPPPLPVPPHPTPPRPAGDRLHAQWHYHCAHSDSAHRQHMHAPSATHIIHHPTWSRLTGLQPAGLPSQWQSESALC